MNQVSPSQKCNESCLLDGPIQQEILSLVLVAVVVATYLPVDEVLKTNVQSKLLSNLRVNMGTVVRVVMTVLFLCLFLNNDVMNLVLLLWLLKAMKM